MIGIKTPHADKRYYHYIIWHHLKNWKSDTTLIDIRPTLISAVQHGNLSPEIAAEYFNISESRIGGVGNYGNVGVLRFLDDPNMYVVDYGAETETVNENRKKIGLYNLADLEKKLRFHYVAEKGNSRFELLKLGGIDVYPSEAKSMLKLKIME